jgi:hypothetical protein
MPRRFEGAVGHFGKVGRAGQRSGDGLLLTEEFGQGRGYVTLNRTKLCL